MPDSQIQPATEIETDLALIMKLPCHLRCEALDTLLLTDVQGCVRDVIAEVLDVCRQEIRGQSVVVLRKREIGRG